MNPLAKIILAGGSLVLSIVTSINAYGLHVASWGWLIGGSAGAVLLMAAASD